MLLDKVAPKQEVKEDEKMPYIDDQDPTVIIDRGVNSDMEDDEEAKMKENEKNAAGNAPIVKEMIAANKAVKDEQKKKDVALVDVRRSARINPVAAAAKEEDKEELKEDKGAGAGSGAFMTAALIK